MPFTRLTTFANGDSRGRVRLQLRHVISPTNATLVPASAATLIAYRQGATMMEDIELYEGMTQDLAVLDAGQIAAGDQLFIESTMDSEYDWLTVTAVAANRTSITVQYSGYRLALQVGTRLTPANARPQMYARRIGDMPITSAQSDAQGIVEFSLSGPGSSEPAPGFDFIVRYAISTGWPPQLQAVAPRADTNPSVFVYAGDYPSVQDAIDATPRGGTLFFPEGTYTAPAPTGWRITKPMTIQGAGKVDMFDLWPGDYGTRFRPFNAGTTADGAKDSTVFNVVGPATLVVLRDFIIENALGQPTTSGSGDGIRFDARAGYLGYCRVENISIRNMGRDGIHVEGTDYGGLCLDQSTFSRVAIGACRGRGINLKFAVDLAMDNVLAVGNLDCGLYAQHVSMVHLFHCLFNGNGNAFTVNEWPHYDRGQLYIDQASRITVNACDFEAWTGKYVDQEIDGVLQRIWTPNAVPHAIVLKDTAGGSVTNCATFNEEYQQGPTESVFINLIDNVTGVFIAGHQVSGVDYYVYVLAQRGNCGNVVLPAATTADTSGSNVAPCRVDVANDSDTNTSNPSGGNLALIPLMTAATFNTTKLSRFTAGVQLPVVSSTNVITHPVKDGMVVIDAAAHCIKFRLDGVWRTVTST